jgi:hypothetical protein
MSFSEQGIFGHDTNSIGNKNKNRQMRLHATNYGIA